MAKQPIIKWYVAPHGEFSNEIASEFLHAEPNVKKCIRKDGTEGDIRVLEATATEVQDLRRNRKLTIDIYREEVVAGADNLPRYWDFNVEAKKAIDEMRKSHTGVVQLNELPPKRKRRRDSLRRPVGVPH
jgi:hypothetical protein